MNEQQAITLLRNPATIKERSQQLFQHVVSGNSDFFAIDETQLTACCQFVLSLIPQSIAVADIPFHSRWRHFNVGDVDRMHSLQQHRHFPADKTQQGRVYYELVLLSVLLDAGAGSSWQYQDTLSQQTWGRSEGLALASLAMYTEGMFSSAPNKPLVADAIGLQQLTVDKLSEAMQVDKDNPLIGLEGRTGLLNALSDVIKHNSHVFTDGRLGCLYDYVINNACEDENTIDAAKVLAIVLELFSPIWPGRITIAGVNLGDVWKHPLVKGDGLSAGLIPFHKLSQWLTYSLLEPLKWQGFSLRGLDKLTGLAEYRNGGLFIDSGVIQVKQQSLLTTPQAPDGEAIIEWRALTICLLEMLWQQALRITQGTAEQFPLVAFLEAGTWKAGRLLAKKRCDNSNPPINILSDGTVF